MVGHVAPEAYVGGPIALVKDGDEIIINVETNAIDLRVSLEELENRLKQWMPHKPNYTFSTTPTWDNLSPSMDAMASHHQY